jgi:hypothetical protein
MSLCSQIITSIDWLKYCCKDDILAIITLLNAQSNKTVRAVTEYFITITGFPDEDENAIQRLMMCKLLTPLIQNFYSEDFQVRVKTYWVHHFKIQYQSYYRI